MSQYDMYLAQLMENGLNFMAVGLAMQLVQRFCVDDKQSTITEVVCALKKQSRQRKLVIIAKFRHQKTNGHCNVLTPENYGYCNVN